MRVLIAEDDFICSETLRTTLKSWNYEPIVTDNGLDALDILQAENPPKLVLLDWMMPQMNGLEVCKNIRKRKNPYIYIIMLTAMAETENIVEGMQEGADDYIVKPYKPQELKVRIRAGERIINLQEERYVIEEKLAEINQMFIQQNEELEALKVELHEKNRDY